jgi:hypothetical protein
VRARARDRPLAGHSRAPRSRVLQLLGSLTSLWARSSTSTSCRRETPPPNNNVVRIVLSAHQRTVRQLQERANSSQHPMRGRSLARRFRGSDIATLRVALPERTGRARVSSKSVGPTCFVGSSPSVGATLYVGPISLEAGCSFEGTRSRPPAIASDGHSRAPRPRRRRRSA